MKQPSPYGLFLMAVLCMCSAGPAWAQLLGQPVRLDQFQNERDAANGGLCGAGPLAQAFAIHWTITRQGDAYHYEYIINAPSQAPERFILNVGEDVARKNVWNETLSFADADPKTYQIHEIAPPSGTQPQLFGLAFQAPAATAQPVIIAFDTDCAPAWGTFYASGTDPQAHGWVSCQGLRETRSQKTADFIPVPDRLWHGTSALNDHERSLWGWGGWGGAWSDGGRGGWYDDGDDDGDDGGGGDDDDHHHNPPAVPEPASAALLTLAAAGLYLGRRWAKHPLWPRQSR